MNILLKYSKGVAVCTTVDDSDLHLVAGKILTISKNGYPLIRLDSKQYVELHRYLLGESAAGMYCDHIDGDKLNNTRANLRICTNSENLRNRGRPLGCLYDLPKGVTYRKSRSTFQAQLSVDGVHMHLGTFKTAEEAEIAYKTAVKLFHGKFAFNGD